MNFLDRNNVLARKLSEPIVRVELGPGKIRAIKDALTIDQFDKESVDIIANLNEGLSFLPDNSINEIHSFHVLEHIENFEFLMKEMHRVLKKGGALCGTVPHFANPYYYSDYTHSKFFGLYSFEYFSDGTYFKRKVPDYYNNFKFKTFSIQLEFDSPFILRRIFKKLQQLVVNSSRLMKEYHEENWCYIFPAYQIRFDLRKP